MRRSSSEPSAFHALRRARAKSATSETATTPMTTQAAASINAPGIQRIRCRSNASASFLLELQLTHEVALHLAVRPEALHHALRGLVVLQELAHLVGVAAGATGDAHDARRLDRSEEHTSELQSHSF